MTTLFDTQDAAAVSTRVIAFKIAHAPVAQPRQRFRIVWPPRATYMRFHELVKKVFVQNYVPKDDEVRQFKAAAQWAARRAYQGPPLECPVILDAVYVFPRHKAKCWKTQAMPRYPHTEKPDRDNVEKALLDALTGIILKDDSCVFSGKSEKWRASGLELPHVEVRITPVEEE